jgi:hypothetical protein
MRLRYVHVAFRDARIPAILTASRTVQRYRPLSRQRPAPDPSPLPQNGQTGDGTAATRVTTTHLLRIGDGTLVDRVAVAIPGSS